MTPLEKFAGFYNLLPDFLAKLDRNFNRVSVASIFAVTSGYSFKNEDTIDSLQVSAASGNLTIYLPPQPNGNRRRRVIKTDASANTVTLDGNGNLINGAATVVLANQYDYVEVEPTGTGWLVINSEP